MEADASRVQFDIHFVPRVHRKAVHYELVRGTVSFRAMINGKQVWALLDNGASTSLIDETFARSLGLQMASVKGAIVTSTGTLKRWRVPAVDIKIPGQIGMQAPLFATDLSRLSAFAGRPISLIIGKEYFDVLMFVFTPRNRQFQIGPSGSLRLPADTPHLDLQGPNPRTEVMVAGQPALLTIDLGNGGDISLGQRAWDRLGMAELPSSSARSVNATGVIANSVGAIVDEVSLGSKHVRGAKVALTSTLPDVHDGYIGFGILSRFNFAIDVKAQRLWLIPPFAAE